jgi:iron complex outermembrane receptor protein
MQFVRNIQISYAFTNINKSTGEFNSYYALDNLKHKLGVNISHALTKKLAANWNVSYQDRNGTYGKWDDATRTTTEAPYNAFWLLDGKLVYTHKFVSVFAECSNILDADYIDLGNIEQPDGGLRQDLKLNCKKATQRIPRDCTKETSINLSQPIFSLCIFVKYLTGLWLK